MIYRGLPNNNLNDIYTPGYYYTFPGVNTGGLPGVAYNVVIALGYYSYAIQIALPVIQNDNLYARIRWENGTWLEWHKIW